MKYFNRITPRDKVVMLTVNVNEDMKRFYVYALKCHELEDKIESGELCDRDEVRKETAREILQRIMLSSVFTVKNAKEYTITESALEEIAMEYGVELEDEE